MNVHMRNYFIVTASKICMKEEMICPSNTVIQEQVKQTLQNLRIFETSDTAKK